MRGKTNKGRAFSNPNLLDNPWFTVNQRGNTSASIANSGFLVDRWKIYSYQHGTASVVDNGIQLDGEFDFGEQIESSRIPNKSNLPITLSAMLSDGTILSKTIILQNNGGREAFSYSFSNGFRIAYVRNWDNTGTDLFFYNSIGGNFTVRAGKLELGTISTLANDIAPNYAEELAKCRRYFRRINVTKGSHCAMAYAWNSKLALVLLTLSCAMRTNPTVTLVNLVLVDSNVTKYTISSKYTYLPPDSNHLQLNLNITDLPVGTMLVLQAPTENGYVDISAEL